MIVDVNGMKNLEKVPQELPKLAKFKTLPRFLSDFSYEYSIDSRIFTSKINVMGRRLKDAKLESTLAARKIADLAGEKPTICLLPGPESQLMFQTFWEAGVKFDAVVLKFKDGLNVSVVNEAIEMCVSRGIQPKIIEIDIVQFLESGKFFEYAEKYLCRSPEICLHMWLFEQIDTAPVLSGHFAVPLVHDGLIFWSGVPTDLHMPYFRYFEMNNRAGEPWFFLNSMEFAVSYLGLQTNESLRNLEVRSTDTYDHSARFIKASQEMGFKIVATEKPGSDFEKLKKVYDDKMALSDGEAFNSLFTLPLELRIAPAKTHRQMVPLSVFTGKPDSFVGKQIQIRYAAVKNKYFGF